MGCHIVPFISISSQIDITGHHLVTLKDTVPIQNLPIPLRLAHLAISSVPGVTTIQPAELSIAKCAIYLNSLVLWMIHYCELESRFRSHTCLLFRFQMTPLPISHEKSLCLTSAPGVMMHSFGHCVRLITRIPLKETLFGCK